MEPDDGTRLTISHRSTFLAIRWCHKAHPRTRVRHGGVLCVSLARPGSWILSRVSRRADGRSIGGPELRRPCWLEAYQPSPTAAGSARVLADRGGYRGSRTVNAVLTFGPQPATEGATGE